MHRPRRGFWSSARRDCARWLGRPAPFCARRMLVRTHVRTVQHERFKIGLLGEMRKEFLPQAGCGPGIKPFIDGLPWTELFRHVSPGSARAQNPEYAIEHQAGVLGGPASALRAHRAHERFETLPKVVRDVMAAHGVKMPQAAAMSSFLETDPRVCSANGLAHPDDSAGEVNHAQE